jgi:hypothetical protein
MEALLIKQDSAEWNRMWQQLAEHPINKDQLDPMIALNPENGETWQYMGSFRGDDSIHKPRTIHQFRHRSFPTTFGEAFYLFDASPEMTDEDIDKIIPIK